LPSERIHIIPFLQDAPDNLILDVRSPAEYGHAHIPGAISLPLFTDEERKIVGTAYKQQSREVAIKIGLDFFGPKMRKMVEEVEQLSANVVKDGQPKTVFIYCWRGGMRSAAVAWLLDLYGFKIKRLAGGYKAFRNHVLQSFEQPFSLRVLGGFTGSGKTDVLKTLKAAGHPVIDLEDLAAHKGSAFGGLNMPAQPSQEMFENLLSRDLLSICGQKQTANIHAADAASVAGSPIWIEDESQRIGNLNIPPAFWKKMRSSPVFFLEIPFEERLSYLTTEYGTCDVPNLMEAVLRINKRLGGLETKNTITFLEQGNLKEAFRILLHYYDKHYLKGLHNRESLDSLLTKFHCDTVSPGNGYLLSKQQTV
jgi:tRNA 2-selenouridine synthase